MSSPTPAGGASAPAPAAPAGPSPLKVGIRFVRQYYETLMSTPDKLHHFYQPKASFLSHGVGSEPTEPAGFESYGMDKADRWSAGGRNMRIEFKDGAIDAQPSIGGGILLVVTGHVTLAQPEQLVIDERKAFVHTFFLAPPTPNSKRFYVHNDILRFPKVAILQSVPTTNGVASTPAPVAADAPAEAATPAAPSEPAQNVPTEDVATQVTEPIKTDAPPVPTEPPAPTAEEKATAAESAKTEPQPIDETAPTEPTTNDDYDEAPGGGVEESKEIESDDDDDDDVVVVVEEEKVDAAVTKVAAPAEAEPDATSEPAIADEPTPEVTAPKPDMKEAPVVPSEPKEKSGGRNRKPRNGRGKSPAATKQQADPPAKPAPKPVPSTWASLVASTPSSGSTPPPPSPARTKPPTPAVDKSKSGSAPDANSEAKTSSAPPTSASAGGGRKEGNSGANSNSKASERRNDRERVRRDPDCTIVVKRFPEGTKEADVVALFEPMAKKVNSKIVGATVSSHRTVAFVDFDSAATVLSIIETHRSEPLKLNGRVLEVDQKTVEQRARRNAKGGGSYRSGSPSNGRFQGGNSSGGRSYRRDNRGRNDRGPRGGGRGGR